MFGKRPNGSTIQSASFWHKSILNWLHFKWRRKIKVTKCNNLNIRQKLVTKDNIRKEQKTQKMKSMRMYIEGVLSTRKGEWYYRWKCTKHSFIGKWNKHAKTNQRAYYQKNKTFLPCFPTKTMEWDFKIFWISDQNLGPMYLPKN